MTRFVAREGIEASFDVLSLGEVEAVDIGPFDDPDQPDLQYYIFSHHARQDVIRLVSAGDVGPLLGRLGMLRLDCEGARYSVEAVCTHQEALSDGRVRLSFEAQQEATVRASARERHGVEGLGAALLLDALADEE